MSNEVIITLRQLVDLDACEEQCDEFERIWGQEVIVSEEEFIKHAKVFDWNWAMSNLLPYEESVECDNLITPLLHEMSSALEEARRKCKAWNDSFDKLKELREDWYTKIDEVRARAFAQLYIKAKENEDERVTAAATGADATDTPAARNDSNEEVEYSGGNGDEKDEFEDVGVDDRPDGSSDIRSGRGSDSPDTEPSIDTDPRDSSRAGMPEV